MRQLWDLSYITIYMEEGLKKVGVKVYNTSFHFQAMSYLNPDCLRFNTVMLDLLLRKEEKDWLRQLNRMRHLLFTELCQRVPTLFDLPVPGIGFWNRKNETSTSLSPTVLSTNSTNPRREWNIYFDLAAPEPATAASTPPTSCADFASLAGYRFPPALCACHWLL